MKKHFEIESNSNILFVTNQCNNHCIMCCQPPKVDNDFEFFHKINEKLIKTAPKGVKNVCITGGEPTRADTEFFELIRLIRQHLPETDIHILSNGRSFMNNDFTHELKVIGEDKILVGVPIHSDYAKDHDIIAGSKNAFTETMLGLYNLADECIPIELRVVINKLNYKRLFQISNFIFKNLSFVSWVAYMGMEDTGYATRNSRKIWIEPIDYINHLCDAVEFLAGWNIPVSIYNIPLCLLPKVYHKFASRSISDWKTKYIDICEICSKKNKCCGLFSTSKKIYQGLKPL